jgi:hypothetical protein
MSARIESIDSTMTFAFAGGAAAFGAAADAAEAGAAAVAGDVAAVATGGAEDAAATVGVWDPGCDGGASFEQAARPTAADEASAAATTDETVKRYI